MESQRGFIVQWHITDKCNLQCQGLYSREAACTTYNNGDYNSPDPPWYNLEVP